MIRGNSQTVVGNEDSEYRELEKGEVRGLWEEDMGKGAGKVFDFKYRNKLCASTHVLMTRKEFRRSESGNREGTKRRLS